MEEEGGCHPALWQGCLNGTENPFRWKAQGHRGPSLEPLGGQHIEIAVTTFLRIARLWSGTLCNSPAGRAKPRRAVAQPLRQERPLTCGASHSVGIYCDSFRTALNRIRLDASFTTLNPLASTQQEPEPRACATIALTQTFKYSFNVVESFYLVHKI